MCVVPSFENGAHILDVGGGDGELINILLARYPSVKVTMIDIASNIGASVKPELNSKVTKMPRTSIAEYEALGLGIPDYIIISDVIHHVIEGERQRFFLDIKGLVGNNPVKIIVKDIEPGYFRSHLSLLADRYISGDKTVSLISRADLVALVCKTIPGNQVHETELFNRDKPNYCLVFYRGN